MTYIRQGLGLVKSQFPSVIILFLYQLLWGLFLYRLVDTAVTALLQRYPDPPPTGLSRILFLLEGEINLSSSPEIRLYLGLLIGMAILRLLLTPLFQAGILYGLVPAESRANGLPLFQGMKKWWKPVSLFYLIELVLILLPALWVVPGLTSLWPKILSTNSSATPWLIALAYILGWLTYGWVVRQSLLFAQFGYLFKSGIWNSLILCFKHILEGIGISLLLCAFGLLLFLLFGAASWFWTGMLALILQQTYPLFRSTFKIWRVTSQYQLWQAKTQNS
ncbi:hypothetical protein ACFQ3W_24060 [Paenibacillus puldeungensis]|uniref:DUF975 family protein n=1 Tax=Paenibacillus puldeungensis TaxID=696536 RepID=A0ABW3S3Q0_9BACL